MRVPKNSLALAILLALLFSASTRSYADTYQIFGLGIDNTQFYGMTDSGAVVLYASFLNCGNPATGCYETFLNGVSTGDSDVVPADSWDFKSGSCTTLELSKGPCSISDNGWTAILQNILPYSTSVFIEPNSEPLQLVTTANGIDGIFAVNGSGDIVFDNANLDEWYEAVDLTTLTPEPGSFLLLGTGILALGGLMFYRRRTCAST